MNKHAIVTLARGGMPGALLLRSALYGIVTALFWRNVVVAARHMAGYASHGRPAWLLLVSPAQRHGHVTTNGRIRHRTEYWSHRHEHCWQCRVCITTWSQSIGTRNVAAIITINIRIHIRHGRDTPLLIRTWRWPSLSEYIRVSQCLRHGYH